MALSLTFPSLMLKLPNGLGLRYRSLCHVCVEFFDFLPCSKRYIPGYLDFPLFSKKNINFHLICIELCVWLDTLAVK